MGDWTDITGSYAFLATLRPRSSSSSSTSDAETKPSDLATLSFSEAEETGQREPRRQLPPNTCPRSSGAVKEGHLERWIRMWSNHIAIIGGNICDNLCMGDI